ncbi:MAG TPA: glycosyltransferase family 2 protein [Pyrinomonadaceae bacterium]|nr:glycosyltransferase family 2 protein [Pyrinomonadaceae bacterium]
MYLYYFLAAVACWFGIQSLLNGRRFAAYVRRETSRALPDFQPFVSVIAPTRGFEAGFEDNIRPLLAQDYRAYEALFVFDDDADPGVEIVEGLGGRIVISGPAKSMGQKVHNLIAAVGALDTRCEVVVFVDTDARPDNDWLRKLVAPLADETLGASTGYRWFIPERGGIASRLRGVWNASIASALGANAEKNFCWGGSTAIRRSTFERLNVVDHWQGTVSDDFTITRVLKDAKLTIHFTPNCLVPSIGDCGFRELLEFTTRQIKITRVYASNLWLPLMLGSGLFTIVFFGGIVLWLASGAVPVLVIVAVLFLLGAAKSFIRWRAVSIPLSEHRSNRELLAHIFLWPVASLLYFWNTIVAGFSRRIKWRGITYELKSSSEAVIISREPALD